MIEVTNDLLEVVALYDALNGDMQRETLINLLITKYEQNKWRPIDTAPKNIEILGIDQEYCYIAHWDTSYSAWRSDFDTEWGAISLPTHWQPVPVLNIVLPTEELSKLKIS